jgi:TonB family protein
MNTFLAFTTLIAFSLFWNQPAQTSLEKRAVEDTKRTLASELDAELPKLPFAEWFGKVVGSDAGTVWQLSECGGPVEVAPNSASGDVRACVEANSLLHDGRRVIVRIAVGTFKQGIVGHPAFHVAVIEQNNQLHSIQRLRDVQGGLLEPEKLAKRRPVELPAITQNTLMLNDDFVERDPIGNAEELGRLIPIEDPPPPAPPPAPSPTPTPISFGDATVKVQPLYPAKARRVNATGSVDVQVTISQEGRVTEAKAISGHTLLREAAEEAARQWVFKPAIVNGSAVSTQIVLTFLFKAPGGDDD